MIGRSEGNENYKETHAIEIDVSMRACLNDVPFKIARPFAISMSLFGLLHLSGKERRWAPISKIYSTVVLLLLWAMFIRCFTLYGSEGFGRVLIVKLVIHWGAFLCAAAATSTYMACRRQNSLVAFLTRWSKLHKLNQSDDQTLGEGNPDDCIKKTQQSLSACLIACWLAMLTACGSFEYFIFMNDDADFLLSPMDRNHPQVLLVKSLLYVINIYMSASSMFTLCLFYNIGAVVYGQFRTFHVKFQKAVQRHDIVDIGHYRRRHQEICLLVEDADDILSVFTAVCILSSTVCGMLVLYGLLRDESAASVSLGFTLLWFLGDLVSLGVIAVGGGYLNQMAHAPLKTIHNFQLKTTSTETSLQMTMFLSKLTGEPIGLTAMGMFVIDKTTILTIAGAFLTYFIVLLQFTPPDQPEPFANCTASITG